MKIGVINYGAGNLTSVLSALNFLDVDFFESSDPDKLQDADKIIFPGVGQASSAMHVIKKLGLDFFIKEWCKRGKFFLGICLGNQIILDYSEEDDTKCLGLIQGRVAKFPKSINLKIPQIGWNTIDIQKKSSIFNGLDNNSSFYFVHSYYTDVTNKGNILAVTNYGINFASVLQKENIFSVQFHPEKSGKSGLTLLKNFIKME